MAPLLKPLVLLISSSLLISGSANDLFKFRRSIIASGTGVGMFYKLELTLGTCGVTQLFMDSKIWATIKFNRIFDIYYKSGDPSYLVSKVVVTLLINNTDVYGRSEDGIGFSEFSGFLILPSRSGIILYTLVIYSCSHNSTSSNKNNVIIDTSPAPDIFKDAHSSEFEDLSEEESEESS